MTSAAGRDPLRGGDRGRDPAVPGVVIAASVTPTNRAGRISGSMAVAPSWALSARSRPPQGRGGRSGRGVRGGLGHHRLLVVRRGLFVRRLRRERLTVVRSRAARGRRTRRRRTGRPLRRRRGTDRCRSRGGRCGVAGVAAPPPAPSEHGVQSVRDDVGVALLRQAAGERLRADREHEDVAVDGADGRVDHQRPRATAALLGGGEDLRPDPPDGGGVERTRRGRRRRLADRLRRGVIRFLSDRTPGEVDVSIGAGGRSSVDTGGRTGRSPTSARRDRLGLAHGARPAGACSVAIRAAPSAPEPDSRSTSGSHRSPRAQAEPLPGPALFPRACIPTSQSLPHRSSPPHEPARPSPPRPRVRTGWYARTSAGPRPTASRPARTEGPPRSPRAAPARERSTRGARSVRAAPAVRTPPSTPPAATSAHTAVPAAGAAPSLRASRSGRRAGSRRSAPASRGPAGPPAPPCARPRPLRRPPGRAVRRPGSPGRASGRAAAGAGPQRTGVGPARPRRAGRRSRTQPPGRRLPARPRRRRSVRCP